MISAIERGAKSPTVTTVVRLAQALGVSASALIDGGRVPRRAFAFYVAVRVPAVNIPRLGKAWDQQRPAAASTSCAIRSLHPQC